jgi:hypothetical protein
LLRAWRGGGASYRPDQANTPRSFKFHRLSVAIGGLLCQGGIPLVRLLLDVLGHGEDVHHAHLLAAQDVRRILDELDLALRRDRRGRGLVDDVLALFLQRCSQFSHFVIVVLLEIGQATQEPFERDVGRVLCSIAVRSRSLFLCLQCDLDGIHQG